MEGYQIGNYHPVVQKLINLLTSKAIHYQKFEHEEVRTSEEAARTRPGFSLSQGAKALIVKVGRGGSDKFVMVVVPGDKKFDSKKVKKLLEAKDLRFATEEEVGEVTGGVKVGGVPPFGSLFGIPTYMDELLRQNEKIVFNAGDRRVSVAISLVDYEKLESPQIVGII